MGKKTRRIYSPKYAVKYATIRENYRKLRGEIIKQIEEEVITKLEAEQAIDALDEVAEVAENLAKEEDKKVIEAEEAKKTSKPKPKRQTRKKTTTSTKEEKPKTTRRRPRTTKTKKKTETKPST